MTDLKNVFQLCVTVLSEVCKVDGPVNENMYTLIKSLLQVADGVLMWNFLPPPYILFILGIVGSLEICRKLVELTRF